MIIKTKNIKNKEFTFSLNTKKKKKLKNFNSFKQSFLNTKKITFFKKLQTYFNDRRLILIQLSKYYLQKNNRSILIKYNSKVGHSKFFFFLVNLELRLSTLLLRARFFFKLSNCFNAIKLNLVLLNGIIINKINFLVKPLGLFQKRRIKQHVQIIKKKIRLNRLQWRDYRWKKARFIFWQIRKQSHFNLYLVKKQNSVINFLEINYKIPAAILLRQPFFKELVLKNECNMIGYKLLQKIYFIY